MAEEISVEKCQALYALLTKKDLSDDEKAQISETIKDSPEILAHGGFVGCVKLPDLAFEYTTPEKLPELLDKNREAIGELKQVLDNLQSLTVKEGDTVKPLTMKHNGVNKTCAAFVLDTMVLDNGEIIGTQLAKNIHFLNTAQRDSLISEEDCKQTHDFYQSLYETKSSYHANRNMRNISGQKVGDIMATAISLRKTAKDSSDDEKLKGADYHAEDVKDQVFMGHMDEKRRTLTIDDLRMRRYRGESMTVEEKKRLAEDEEKDASMDNNKDLNPHIADEKKGGEKFKDIDIIEYMYNEWFLAGLSWMFDKAEDLGYAALDVVVDGVEQRWALRKEKRHEEEAADLKTFKKRMEAFDKGVVARDKSFDEAREKRKKEAVTDVTEMFQDYFASPTPEKEAALKRVCSEHFVEQLKADHATDPKKVDAFLKLASKGYDALFEEEDCIAKIAMRQVHAEMRYEAMSTTYAWKNSTQTEFLSDSEIMAKYDERCKERQKALKDAVIAIREDVKIKTEYVWLQMGGDKAKEDKFITDNIRKVYDARMALAATPDDKRKIAEHKKKFEEQYAEIDPSLRGMFVENMIADMHVHDFLDKQNEAAKEAQKLQEEDLDNGKYQFNDAKPNKKANELLSTQKSDRQDAIDNGALNKKLLPKAGEAMEADQTLFEATFATEKEAFFGALGNYVQYKYDALEARLADVVARKEALQKFIRKVKMHSPFRSMPVITKSSGRV